MYLFFILLLGICLCLSVNSFLNGAIKAQIFIIGNILALIFVELSFYFYDWQIGCTAIVVYLGVGITLKPLGANIAAWILRKAFQVE